MAETKKDTHIVEIPVDQEHQNNHKILSCITANIAEAIEDHPLTEISDSPGHLLLLKLWQRQETLFAARIARKETKLTSLKSELFTLSSFFFIFHFFFLTLLFTSSTNSSRKNAASCCNKWWLPSTVSLCTSMVFVVMVHAKLRRYWKVWEELQGERGDGRVLSRCIQELRMKGASFDLSKESSWNGNGVKRMKSASVEIKWRPVSWCCRNSLTVFMVCFAGFVFPASKLVLCGL
ncbi:hypothetical protein PIB30_054330 [Stylosanthes scabra]|uniref:Transmembrane protein n=1 Tax=Stylosanthes scabra TaxID=79078 RepID=A0ABU6VID0_9FABA|nr:hypothetical protein [Stylosanthes scabra]